MTEDGSGRGRLVKWIAVLAVVTAVGGAALVFVGFGADMSDVRSVTVTLRRDLVPPETAAEMRVGDPIYTDIAGSEIGRVVAVEATAQPILVTDAQGNVHLAGDPRYRQVTMTIRGPGRTGDGLVAIGSQVIQVGRGIMTISKRYNVILTVVSFSVD